MKPYTLSTILLAASFAVAKEKISLQWAICDSSPQDVLPKLGLDPTTPPYKENPITYYDELPPVYISEGIMLRAKTNKGQPLSTVKVRFPELKSNVPEFVECGWDQYGDQRTYTCEKRCPRDPESPKIWCDEQLQFVGQYHDLDWSTLAAYGPFPDAKWKVHIGGYKAKFDDVVASDSLHLMEIEAQVPLAKANKAYKKITRHLKKRGVVLCDPQDGKTLRLFHAMGYTGNGRSEL